MSAKDLLNDPELQALLGNDEEFGADLADLLNEDFELGGEEESTTEEELDALLDGDDAYVSDDEQILLHNKRKLGNMSLHEVDSMFEVNQAEMMDNVENILEEFSGGCMSGDQFGLDDDMIEMDELESELDGMGEEVFGGAWWDKQKANAKARKTKRKVRKEHRQDAREDRQDERKEKRADRREDRQDARAGRKAKRADRREDRQDARAGRKEKRQDRRTKRRAKYSKEAIIATKRRYLRLARQLGNACLKFRHLKVKQKNLAAMGGDHTLMEDSPFEIMSAAIVSDFDGMMGALIDEDIQAIRKANRRDRKIIRAAKRCDEKYRQLKRVWAKLSALGRTRGLQSPSQIIGAKLGWMKKDIINAQKVVKLTDKEKAQAAAARKAARLEKKAIHKAKRHEKKAQRKAEHIERKEERKEKRIEKRIKKSQKEIEAEATAEANAEYKELKAANPWGVFESDLEAMIDAKIAQKQAEEAKKDAATLNTALALEAATPKPALTGPVVAQLPQAKKEGLFARLKAKREEREAQLKALEARMAREGQNRANKAKFDKIREAAWSWQRPTPSPARPPVRLPQMSRPAPSKVTRPWTRPMPSKPSLANLPSAYSPKTGIPVSERPAYTRPSLANLFDRRKERPAAYTRPSLANLPSAYSPKTGIPVSERPAYTRPSLPTPSKPRVSVRPPSLPTSAKPVVSSRPSTVIRPVSPVVIKPKKKPGMFDFKAKKEAKAVKVKSLLAALKQNETILKDHSPALLAMHRELRAAKKNPSLLMHVNSMELKLRDLEGKLTRVKLTITSLKKELNTLGYRIK